MDNPSEAQLIEARLLREIASIDQQIGALQQQRREIESLLIRVRREDLASRTVTRKNSIGRILIENAITEALRLSPKPLRNYQLFQSARLRDPRIKESTFRSHLHRMEQRGDIKRLGTNRGLWMNIISDDQGL